MSEYISARTKTNLKRAADSICAVREAIDRYRFERPTNNEDENELMQATADLKLALLWLQRATVRINQTRIR